MATLLVMLRGSRLFNLTLWPPYIYVYNDMLIYKRRNWFAVKEITIPYNQIAQANLIRGIFFGQVDIMTSGTGDVQARFVNKKGSIKAKRIIDRKIYQAHQKHRKEDDSKAHKQAVRNYERSLHRLQELVERKKITKREFNKRKKTLLKKFS